MIMDIGVGLMLGVLVDYFYTGQPHIHLVALGVISTLIPDLDYFVYMQRNKWKRDRYTYKHRDLLHQPIPFSLGGAAILSLISPPLGILWFLGTMYHFIHDTFNAWGVQWLSPFSERFILIAKYSPLVIIPNKEKRAELVEKYGNDNWLETGYLTFNLELAIELVVFTVGVIAAIAWLL